MMIWMYINAWKLTKPHGECPPSHFSRNIINVRKQDNIYVCQYIERDNKFITNDPLRLKYYVSVFDKIVRPSQAQAKPKARFKHRTYGTQGRASTIFRSNLEALLLSLNFGDNILGDPIYH